LTLINNLNENNAVDIKYANLEELLSSNVGEKLKEACIVNKPSIPKPS
jgi:hypothetical protein